jgi:hypothetical protein
MKQNRYTRPIRATDFTGPMLAKFWAKIERRGIDECWTWTGAKGDGYGLFTVQPYGRLVGAHRISFALENGQTPPDVFVLHRCDNPACVNPRHLRLGTHQDNMIDRRDKGRDNRTLGETNGCAKLDTWDIICIRADRRPQKVIAKDYGIRQGHVSYIKARKTWRHVPEFEV